MDRGAWLAAVQGVTESQTGLRWLRTHTHTHTQTHTHTHPLCIHDGISERSGRSAHSFMVSRAGIWRTLKISKQKAGSGEHINWGATAGEAEHVGLTGTASHSVDRAPERIRCLLKD